MKLPPRARIIMCRLPAGARQSVLRRRPTVRIVPLAVVICTLVTHFVLRPPDARAQAHRFKSDIRAFERGDSLHPPPRGAVLFVGSSSIAGWKSLGTDFPGTPTINRGFGGSEISDVIHFTDRIVLPYEPQTIVLYAGDNDVAAGKTPKQVFEDFRTFVDLVHEVLPQTQIIFLSIKPSIARRHLIDEMRTANTFVKFFARSDERLDYLDLFHPMLDENGQPRVELFAEDGLHLNEHGYALWTRLLKPLLQQE